MKPQLDGGTGWKDGDMRVFFVQEHGATDDATVPYGIPCDGSRWLVPVSFYKRKRWNKRRPREVVEAMALLDAALGNFDRNDEQDHAYLPGVGALCVTRTGSRAYRLDVRLEP